MKWFFLAAFIAALFCSIFWTGVMILSIATHRLAAMGISGVYVMAPLLLFIWERERRSDFLEMLGTGSESKAAQGLLVHQLT